MRERKRHIGIMQLSEWPEISTTTTWCGRSVEVVALNSVVLPHMVQGGKREGWSHIPANCDLCLICMRGIVRFAVYQGKHNAD